MRVITTTMEMDFLDYSDESDSVQEDIQEFDDILGNESDGNDGEHDIEYDDIDGFESKKDDGHIAAVGDINEDNFVNESG